VYPGLTKIAFHHWFTPLSESRISHDRYLYRTARTDDLPSNWQQRVDAAITCAHLNTEQVQAVRSYFKHKVTIVVVPPGTGKSTLVDVILGLEEAFSCRYWVCTHSNSGLDALAEIVETGSTVIK
jgi:hypothetical protein